MAFRSNFAAFREQSPEMPSNAHVVHVQALTLPRAFAFAAQWSLMLYVTTKYPNARQAFPLCDRSRSLSPSRPETAEGEMNAEVAYGYRERKAHADAMSEVAHRLHCLQHLKLKTVIKVTTPAPRPEYVDSAMRTTPSMCKEIASHLHMSSVCNSVSQRKDLVHLVMLSHTMLSPDQCLRC